MAKLSAQPKWRNMFYIRLGLALLMLMSVLEVFRAVKALNNKDLTEMLVRVGSVIGTFALLRIMGVFIDPYLDFAYVTTGSVYGFWLVAYLFFRHNRIRIQSDEIGTEGRLRISENASSIAAEMRRFSRKLDSVINN